MTSVYVIAAEGGPVKIGIAGNPQSRLADLRAALLPLDPGGPLHRQLEADLGAGRRPPWYCCQQEHWLGWLAEYDGPGAYGRANANRSAGFVYNAFQCAPGLAWLAEAAGVPPEIVAAGCYAARAAGPRPAARCGAFRRVVPWALVERALTTATENRSCSASG